MSWAVSHLTQQSTSGYKSIHLLGSRRECSATSNSLFWLMHRLSHVHFTRWTPEGTQSTFRRRRTLAKSMLSSTTTWVTLGDSRFSVSPPFFRICCWKIWYLAFPIPAGRMQTVSPLKVSPGITRDAALEWPNNWLTSQYCVLQLHWISVFHKKIKN